MEAKDFSAFGWRIDRYTFAQGETYTIELRKDTPKEQLANRTFYVGGSATGVSDNTAYIPPARYPGFFYTDMPDVVLAAKTVYTANEPLEWWCVNWHLNNKSFPAMGKFVVHAGGSQNISSEKNLFLCKGEVSVAGIPYAAPCEVPSGDVVAISDAYGVVFS